MTTDLGFGLPQHQLEGRGLKVSGTRKAALASIALGENQMNTRSDKKEESKKKQMAKQK